MAHARIPIVDLADPRGEAVIAATIGRACREIGFFYVVNHAIAPAVVDGAFAQSRRFFAQPEQDKLAVFHKNSKSLAGYEPLCAQSLDQVSAPDLKESYYCSFDLPENHRHVVAGLRSYGANQWPLGLPGFREAMLGYLSGVTELAYRVLALFARSLELPPTHLDPMFPRDGASCHLRLIRYPAHPGDAPPDQLGAGVHTDWGALTLLMQDASGGLQVKTVDDTWVDATPMAGAFVVNIGDLMARWTNDLYRSGPHRVRNDRTGAPRHSMAFFFAPDPHALIECLPTCTGPARPPKYPVCTAGEHMREMVAKTYGAGRQAA